MSLAWYVVQVATNMEDRVQTAIVSSINNKIQSFVDSKQPEKATALQAAFAINDFMTGIELEEYLKAHVILVPKEKIEEIKNGKKREAERKIFPGCFSPSCSSPMPRAQGSSRCSNTIVFR